MSEKFKYSYSAPSERERKEIEYIQKQYQKKDERQLKLERLRNLDNKVKSFPALIALIVGIVGSLIFGLGLAMVLEWDLILWGVLVAFIGLIPISIAYLIFNKLYNKLKKKYSDEIIKLSEELLNGEK